MRMMDRVFDNYVSTPLQKLVFDSIRDEDKRDPHGVANARRMLDTAYGWLDQVMASRPFLDPPGRRAYKPPPRRSHGC
ncbi:hypothetical protein [Thalassobaculum sp.]|uniref:hypothetical protein n=1 Tax=Thalassobaculum sp. TaxID=2022740 RepID=UPI0032EE41DA